MATASQNRQDKIKLVKDLKYGKVHLRQSLLQIDQIEDLDRIFKDKREHYHIIDRDDIIVDNQVSQQNEQQIPAFLTPIERIALYRKEKINKKIKDKMSKIWQQKPKNVTKLRKPKTEKMLETFQQKFRKQMPISYMQDLRESQMNLNRIKKNQKFKFQLVKQNTKPLYISRMQSEKRPYLVSQDSGEMNSTFITQDESARKRFLSLKTSLPQKQRQHFTPARDIVQGKNRDNQTQKVMDIKELEKKLDEQMNEKMLKKREFPHQNSLRFQNNFTQQKNKSQVSVQRSKTQTAYMYAKKRTKSNAEKSMIKSEQSSKQIIETMGNFYMAKHVKKLSYDEMVENVKYDRPFTSSIRRKNYSVLGKESLSPIKEYRGLSEKQRKHFQKKNIDFYKSLLDGLEKYHQEDIPTSIFIIDEIKRVLESEYKITKEIISQLISMIQKMEMDEKSEEILQKLGEFAGFQIVVNFD